MKKNKLISVSLLSGLVTIPVVMSAGCYKNEINKDDEIILDKSVEEVKPKKEAETNNQTSADNSDKTNEDTKVETNIESNTIENSEMPTEGSSNDTNKKTESNNASTTENTEIANSNDGTSENNQNSNSEVNASVSNSLAAESSTKSEPTEDAIEEAKQNLKVAIDNARALENKIDNSTQATYLADWLKNINLKNFIETSQRNYDASGTTYENYISAAKNLNKVIADTKVYYDHALNHTLSQLKSNIDNSQSHVNSYKTHAFAILRNIAETTETELTEANKVYSAGENNPGLNTILDATNKLVKLTTDLINDFSIFKPAKKKVDDAIVEFTATQTWVWENKSKYTNEELTWSNQINSEIINLRQQFMDSATLETLQSFADQIVSKLQEYKTHLKVVEKGYQATSNA
ncbi:hypothetical protein [Mycoplasmopsis felifaucium]|uniref:hypothetical protein n=1 Tax=Mycoplasmopsis felifaucium TaxID=35768 RepID=UPI000480EA37|nr:hypothetical protein [Mycoplasmopsis felifaucium]